MKKLFIITLLLLTMSCAQPIEPVKVEKTSNAGSNVDKLFEKDGYTVYRFEDNGRYVYYVTPQGQTQQTYSENCGKGCVRQVYEESVTLPKSNSNVTFVK